MKRKGILILVLTMVIAASFTSNFTRTQAKATAVQQSTAEQVLALGNAINVQLEAQGANYRIGLAEYLTPDDSGEVGQTVFFANVGNKQLGAHFVAGDPRRGSRTNITYIVDQAEGAIDGLTVAQTTAAIDSAMMTWEAANCSTIPITKRPDIPLLDLGIIEFLNGLGG
ncbi:MAG TPA: hypothetical protein VFZ34_12780 [Blastocatellia bacterium]|nr:hypothetical protein [Blastocatellia bacterium]